MCLGGNRGGGGAALTPSLWCMGEGAGILVGAAGLTGIGKDGGDTILYPFVLPGALS